MLRETRAGYILAQTRKMMVGPMVLVLLYQNSGWRQFGYRFSNDYAVLLFMLIALGLEIGDRRAHVGNDGIARRLPKSIAAQFEVPVDKDGTSVLKYRVRVRY